MIEKNDLTCKSNKFVYPELEE